MSYDTWKTTPPDRSGECTRCDNGEVCSECELHPDDKCECGDMLALHVVKGASAMNLPPLSDCPDCDGANYIED